MLIIFGCAFFTPFSVNAQSAGSRWSILWGTDAGLYRKNQAGRTETLWSGGKVLKVIQTEIKPDMSADSGNSGSAKGIRQRLILLTDEGIFVSDNQKDWEQRNHGLPEKVIKLYEDGKKSFVSTVQEIKDLEIDPQNPEIMVCSVKDAVYLSRSGGRSWENLGMPNYRSNGIKAVAVTSFSGPGAGTPTEANLTIFCSHSIYGVYYINPDKPGAKWTELNASIEKLETTGNPDEISDFAVLLDIPAGGNSTNAVPVIYASQSFRCRVYRLDWESKNWDLLWSDGSDFGALDSLSPGKKSLRFIRDGRILELDLSGGEPRPSRASAEGSGGEPRPSRASAAGSGGGTPTEGSPLAPRLRQDLQNLIKTISGKTKPTCVTLSQNSGRSTADLINFSELWLLDEDSSAKNSGERVTKAAGKEGLYLPVNHAMDSASLKPYLDIIQNRNLNMVVIDMKDDYGRLRFSPLNPLLTNLGRIFRPVDIDVFLKDMKGRGIYTVARIVVFKDPEAAGKAGGKYAVWDGPNNKPWQGYYDVRRKKTPGEAAEANAPLVTALLPADDPAFEILRTWYDEKWVDPFSEEIWDYNASVAEELCSRGFDEIQFDYIRFPTDGYNLGDARYRWRENSMDMDSAILSFLRHARSRIKAPISVDIYGANGWYRTGARTGQEVEMLAPWVDVICPMYYPSHFEQNFLAHDPPELRPYRIYYHGTNRTRLIARNRVIVRPWAQAFYLNVSYDRKYYNADYVRMQAEGVRAAGNGGLTYWNNSGRYEDLPYPSMAASPAESTPPAETTAH